MKAIPLITSIDVSRTHHCLFYFPQFNILTQKEVRDTLTKQVESPDPYFKAHFPDWQEQVELYKRALAAESFVDACTLLYNYEKPLFCRWDMFISPRGDVVEMRACCK